MGAVSSQVLADTGLPVRKSVRRLRWFLASFRDQMRRTSAETGNVFDVSDTVLAAVFVDWLRAFNAQKPARDADRIRYVGFASGLMLRTLIRHRPVVVTHKPESRDESNPAYFWPEGYLYVAFCLNIRALVLEQDFDEQQATVPALSEMRTWWAFRENVAEDSSLAIAFLDLFAGDEPEWSEPDVFRSSSAAQIARRFYREVEHDPDADTP